MSSRYDYDKTGVNPDNKVCSESKDIGNNRIRVFTPLYGAFYVTMFKMWEGDNLLDFGKDYGFEEFLVEPYVKSSIEVYSFISIINPDIGEKVRYSYQVVGGDYLGGSDGIAALYESAKNDSRPVHFDDIVGVPEDMKPSWHPHNASDVFNYGGLITAVDRLRAASTVGSTESFQILITYINEQIAEAKKVFEGLTVQVTDINNTPIDERSMSMSAIYYMLSTGKSPDVMFFVPEFSRFSCDHDQGSIHLRLSSNKKCKNMSLKWAVEHETTDADDFFITSGIMSNHSNGSMLEIKIIGAAAFYRKTFRVGVFDESGRRISLIMGGILASNYEKGIDSSEDSLFGRDFSIESMYTLD